MVVHADVWSDRADKAARDLPNQLLKYAGVPAPILDLFFGSSNPAVPPIDYARIANIVAGQLDDHDFKLAVAQHEQTLGRLQQELKTFMVHWAGADPDGRRALARDLNAIHQELGKVTDSLRGPNKYRALDLLAAVESLRLAVIATMAQERDPASNFSYTQLHDFAAGLVEKAFRHSAGKVVTVFGKPGEAPTVYSLPDIWDAQFQDYTRYNAMGHLATQAETVSLIAAAAQRIASEPGGAPVGRFTLSNSTGQDLVIKYHHAMDPPSHQDGTTWYHFDARTTRNPNPVVVPHERRYNNNQYPLTPYDPATWGLLEGFWLFPEANVEGWEWDRSYAAIRRPSPRATTVVAEPIRPGAAWSVGPGSAFTTSDWFGIYVKADPELHDCIDRETWDWMYVRDYTVQNWNYDFDPVNPSNWDGLLPRFAYSPMNFFGCHAKLVANFQLQQDGNIILRSAYSNEIARRVPFWVKDPEGIRYRIMDYIPHTLSDGGQSYSLPMSHAQCRVKCESNNACVIVRVNTANDNDCLMGSSIDVISNTNDDADVTSWRIISRSGNYVLSRSN